MLNCIIVIVAPPPPPQNFILYALEGAGGGGGGVSKLKLNGKNRVILGKYKTKGRGVKMGSLKGGGGGGGGGDTRGGGFGVGRESA